MDPEWPCIIQALPALPSSPSSTSVVSLPTLVQALAAATDPPPATTPSTASKSSRHRAEHPPSPRRTRSGGAPEWTPAETLALVAEVAAVDDGWSRSVSAFQKWAIVAENLASSSAPRGRARGRAASECRRRWEALAAEYGAVRRWERRSGGGGYWQMSAAARRKAGLPADFDAEVYGAMEALTLVEEALLADAAGAAEEEVEGLVGAGGGGSGGAEVGEQSAGEEDDEGEAGKEDKGEAGEEDVGEAGQDDDDEVGEESEEDDNEMVEEDNDNNHNENTQADDGNATAASDDMACKEEANNNAKKSQTDACQLMNKLHENAKDIHMILKEEAGEEAGQNHNLAVSSDAMESTRQKADELIKSLGGLVSYLNQFTDLIKEKGFENVVGMS
ncbi:hypothetical protein ABZP36_023602 [Zizania latifolia]